MAYKKYIKRDGKVYGPYLYHSKKVNGRVISEYLGKSKDERINKRELLIFLSIGIILLLFLFVTLSRWNMINESLTSFKNLLIKSSITDFVTQQPQQISETNAVVNSIQYPAVVDEPVKWKKEIVSGESGTVKVNLPLEAEKININKIDEGGNKEILNARVTKISPGFFSRILGITSRAISEQGSQGVEILIESSTKYEINYETPAPKETEEQTGRIKKIKVTGSDAVHYENILAHATLSAEAIEEKIKLYKTTEGVKEEVDFIGYDKNNNGLIDYVEWIVPQLSTQTYELIIEISKAEHLNSDKQFISDIYNQVKSLDNVWSETIPADEYVRVIFKQNLTSSRDITLYPRVISGVPKVEVYEKDGTRLIAEFNPINSNEYNKVYLTNLQGSQDTFDLKVTGGSVEFDYIVDPDIDPDITYDGAYTVYTFRANGTFSPPAGVTSVAVLVVGGGGGGGGRHGGGGGGGGLVYNSSYPINGSNITVVVGLGGNYSWSDPNMQSVGRNGGNSTFGDIKALGGGGGGSYTNIVPLGGGSGGGGGGKNDNNRIGGLANQGNSNGTGYGNRGGNGSTSTGGGGGGGAGAPGSNFAGADVGGAGGAGLNYTINGSDVYYAGGGGGGGTNGGGTGGIGGGGNGSNNGGTPGINGTGGGGGGVRSATITVTGKIGGSGIVIVRFLTSSDTTYPIFSDYKDNSANLIDHGIGWFNVTIENTNGTVLLEINNVSDDINITATNLTTNVYNVSYNFTSPGVSIYRWHSWGNGTSHLYNKSEDKIYTVNATVDNSPPIIDLISPIDYANLSSIVDFTCTMADIGGLKNSTLYGNWSGGWHANQTQAISGLINSTNFTKTIPDGIYIWNCYACDVITISNCGFSGANRTFTVDTVPPSISIIYPSNNSNFSYANVNVNYSVSDNLKVQACWYTNSSGAVNYSIVNCANLTTQNWSEGVNNITIYANDSAGNANSSSVSFTVDTTDKIPPEISFTSSTPANDTTTTNTSLIINVSISEPSLQEVKYNWNGINFTIYNDSLMLMYNFDNLSALGEGSTNIYDVSKYGNNGTIVGAGFVNDSGKYGKSLQLTGSNYITTNYVQTGVTQYTIAIWIKTNTSTGVIVQDRGSGGGFSLTLAIHPLCGTTGCTGASAGIPAIGLDSDSIWRGMNGNKRVDDGNWHYVVGVFNSTAGQTISGTSAFFSVYIDGIFSNGLNGDQIGDKASPLTGSGGTIIGYSLPWSQYFTSQFDELRIWNRSLSASEVYQQYVSNLQKYNQTQWYFYVNQSKNSTTGLDNGTYTYFTSAKDIAENENRTETRTITIGGTEDTIYPQFTSYWDNNGTLVDSGTGYFNVTVLNTNGTVTLTYNNTNYTATNSSGNVTTFNVTINGLTSGTYSYNWTSWGNGTSHLSNVSDARSYTVNTSISYSISLSQKLGQQINWSLTSLPAYSQSAEGNNNNEITEYYINISAEGTTVDLYVKGSGNLMTLDLDILGLGNETYSYNSTNASVPSANKFPLTTNYITKIGENLNNGTTVFLKFFLSAPSGQPAGTYNNTLSFKAVSNGQTP